MDELWVRALITAAVWLAVLVLVRWLLRRAYDTWERRLGDTDPAVVARRRTTFSFLSRLAFVIVATIGAWSVLSIFPQTEEIARALLASSAVLAVVAGLALSTPLGNLGAGVLVAFTQPVRIGDRVIDQRQHRLRRADQHDLHGARHGRRAARLRPEHAAHEHGDREPDDPRSAQDRDRRTSPCGSARRSQTPARPSSGPSTRSRASIATARRCSWGRHRQRRGADGQRLGAARRRRHAARLGRARGSARRALGDAGHLAA